MSKRGAMVLCLLSLVRCGAALASANPYLIDLGTLGYTGTNAGSMAYAINNNGVVVGRALNAGGLMRPFIWQNGVMADMNPINGNSAYSWEEPAGVTDPGGGTAYAVNNSGYAAGGATVSLGTHPFLYTGSPTTSVDIYPSANPIPPMAGPESGTAYGINDSGQVVGNHGSTDAPVTTAAFLYNSSDGSKVELNNLISGATGSTAYAINNAGWVVGNYLTSTSYNVPFIYNGSAMANLPLFSGATGGQPKAINASNHVAGIATASDGEQYGFYYNGTTTVQLGTLGGAFNSGGPLTSDARATNSHDQIVGLSLASGGTTSADRRAVQFNLNGTVTDLNVLPTVAGSGWTLTCATGINDNGWIVGWGTNSSGQQHPFLLKPVLPGDSNYDGKVDINDLSRVLTNYDKSTGMSWETGDFNNDNKVDINDLSIVLTNYDHTAGAPAMTAVPEPGTFALLAAALIGFVAACARRRWR